MKGKIITGDGLFTRREVCEQVLQAGGDHALPAKENHPTLRASVATAFAEPPAGRFPP